MRARHTARAVRVADGARGQVQHLVPVARDLVVQRDNPRLRRARHGRVAQERRRVAAHVRGGDGSVDVWGRGTREGRGG